MTMNPFDDREKAFEAKFQFDEELAFKVNARRDMLIGRWVAVHIGLTGEDAESYARSVVVADLEDSQHKAMLRKLINDLKIARAKVGEKELHAELDRLSAVARRQIATEADAAK